MEVSKNSALADFVSFSQEEFCKIILNNYIIGCQVPLTQKLDAIWDFRLNISSGEVVKFSAIPVNIGGWDEVGRIRIELIDARSIAKGEFYPVRKIDYFRP